MAPTLQTRSLEVRPYITPTPSTPLHILPKVPPPPVSPWVRIAASQGVGSHKYADCQEVKPVQDSGTSNNLGKTTHWVILQYEDQHVKVNKTPNLIIPDCPEYLLLCLVVFVMWDTKKPINHQRDVNTHLSPYILQTSLKLCTAGFQKYCSQCFARPTLKASQRMIIFFVF